MRKVLLSVVLAAGALGTALAGSTQARADELVGPGIGNGATIPVAHRWNGGWGYGGWGGRSYYGGGFYPGYGLNRGLYRGYYPYGGGFSPYGGYRSRYYYGGGFYPYGGYRAWPYSGFYGPGFYW